MMGVLFFTHMCLTCYTGVKLRALELLAAICSTAKMCHCRLEALLADAEYLLAVGWLDNKMPVEERSAVV